MRLLPAATLPAMLLAGCASTTPPAPPVLSYAATGCAAQPDLASAISLNSEKKKKVWTVDRPVAGDTPCLTRNGVSGPYLVYALPSAGTARMVELGAVMEAGRLFSPSVILLDAQGVPTRGFAADQYMFRTGVLSVQFTPQEHERFALVTADPARVGQSYDAIRTGTSSTYIPVGAYGGSNWRSGHEAQVSLGYSYEGTVRASMVAPEEAE